MLTQLANSAALHPDLLTDARLDLLADLARPVTDAVGAGLGCVSPLGWTTLAFGVVAFVAGWVLGWHEFRIIGAALLVLLGLSLLFLIGRTQLALNEPARRHRKEPSYFANQAALEAAEAKRNRRAERNRRLANEQG